MTNKLRRIVIMAGGTGGHVFPGLAVAKQLRANGVEVHWLGTQKGIEATVVPAAGFPIHFVSVSGLRGKSMRENLFAPLRLTKAITQSMRILRRLKPDVVLGMGGFVSGPGGIASWLLRYPLVIHEQNAKPGMTNEWLAHLAKKVLTGFPNTFTGRQSRVEVVGNPVREEITQIVSPAERAKGYNRPLNLLVLGGSLGATAINEMVPQALERISSDMRPFVYHQSGERHFADAVAHYEQAGVAADVVPFIKEMDKAYAWADIVICRAGALTIAELCTVGVGAILIPYPYAAGDHQTVNANYMAKHGAGLLIQQSELTAESLGDVLQQFIELPKRCYAMAQAAYALREVDATERVLTICEEVCH